METRRGCSGYESGPGDRNSNRATVELSGRTVLVTGGAQGIGAAIARALAARGAHVVIGDLRSPDATLAAIADAGGQASGGICDIADPGSIETFVAESLERHPRIEGLVNNAAMFSSLRPTRFEQISSDEFDRVLQVNVRGTFEVIKAVMPVMRRQGYGKIVNVGSSSVFKGSTMLLHYVSSKGAIHALTGALAREVGPDGVRVNAVAPGLTPSDGVRTAGNLPPERIDEDRRTRALAREQTPEDLTGVVAFLLSAHSDFMTGQTLVVDGGSQLH